MGLPYLNIGDFLRKIRNVRCVVTHALIKSCQVLARRIVRLDILEFRLACQFGRRFIGIDRAARHKACIAGSKGSVTEFTLPFADIFIRYVRRIDVCFAIKILLDGFFDIRVCYIHGVGLSIAIGSFRHGRIGSSHYFYSVLGKVLDDRLSVSCNIGKIFQVPNICRVARNVRRIGGDVVGITLHLSIKGQKVITRHACRLDIGPIR